MIKIKKSVWITILFISIGVVVAVAVFLFRYMNPQEPGRDAFTSTAKATEAVPSGTFARSTPYTAPDEAETASPTTVAWGNRLAQMSGVDIDFNELNAINPDVYAWLFVPNTNVDYPVARSSRDGDDSFYLEHNIYRQYQFSGMIYSEIRNNPDMHDRVTVMYGHNMLNGSMFASLHNFEDKDFFDENNTIFVVTKDKIFTYLIYSAYTFDDRHILNSFSLNDDEVFQEYINSTLHPHSYNANVREGVELTTNNKILTLSTCTSGASNTRYLVQGVLVDERNR